MEIHEAHSPDAAHSPDVGAGPRVELRSAVGSAHVAIRATESGERRYQVGGTVAKDGARLAAAYPKQPDGKTLLPFRRLFLIIVRAE